MLARSMTVLLSLVVALTMSLLPLPLDLAKVEPLVVVVVRCHRPRTSKTHLDHPLEHHDRHDFTASHSTALIPICFCVISQTHFTPS